MHREQLHEPPHYGIKESDIKWKRSFWIVMGCETAISRLLHNYPLKWAVCPSRPQDKFEFSWRRQILKIDPRESITFTIQCVHQVSGFCKFFLNTWCMSNTFRWILWHHYTLVCQHRVCPFTLFFTYCGSVTFAPLFCEIEPTSKLYLDLYWMYLIASEKWVSFHKRSQPLCGTGFRTAERRKINDLMSQIWHLENTSRCHNITCF